MSISPLVSICIPVYNGEALIERALQSLENQNYSNIEVVLCDDASLDLSVNLIEDWAKHSRWPVTLVFHDRNLGPGAAHVSSVKASNGDYFVCLAQDDLLADDHVTLCMAQMLSDSNLVLIPSQQLGEVKGGVLPRRRKSDLGVNWSQFIKLVQGNFIFAPGVLVKRAKWDPAFLGYANVTAQDWELWVNLALRGAFGSPAGGVLRGLHDSNLHRSQSTIAQEIDKSLMYLRLLSSEAMKDVSRSLEPKGIESLRRLLKLGIQENVYMEPLSSMIIGLHYPKLKRSLMKRPDVEQLELSAKLTWNAFNEGEDFDLASRDILVDKVTKLLTGFEKSTRKSILFTEQITYSVGQRPLEPSRTRRLTQIYRSGWIFRRLLKPTRELRMWVLSKSIQHSDKR